MLSRTSYALIPLLLSLCAADTVNRRSINVSACNELSLVTWIKIAGNLKAPFAYREEINEDDLKTFCRELLPLTLRVPSTSRCSKNLPDFRTTLNRLHEHYCSSHVNISLSDKDSIGSGYTHVRPYVFTYHWKVLNVGIWLEDGYKFMPELYSPSFSSGLNELNDQWHLKLLRNASENDPNLYLSLEYEPFLNNDQLPHGVCARVAFDISGHNPNNSPNFGNATSFQCGQTLIASKTFNAGSILSQAYKNDAALHIIVRISVYTQVKNGMKYKNG